MIDNQLKITILISMFLHVVFLGIPIPKLLSFKVQSPDNCLSQIEIVPLLTIESHSQRTEDRGQRSEVRGQRTEDSIRCSEKIRKPNTEYRIPNKTAVSSQELAINSQPVEVEEPQEILQTENTSTKELRNEGTEKPVEQVVIAETNFDKILNYQREVRNKIEQAKEYPVFARRNEIEGVSKVQFTILSNGRVEGIKILKSSGSKILDVSACNIIRRSAPYPPLPKEIAINQLQMQIDIMFNLEEIGG